MPSEPTSSRHRSKPVTFFTVGPPAFTTSPSAETSGPAAARRAPGPCPSRSGRCCPTASTPPTVAPGVGQRDELAVLGQRGVELGHRRAGAAADRHLLGLDPDDAGRRLHLAGAARSTAPPTSHCVRPPTHGDRAVAADLLGEPSAQIHAPSGHVLQVAAPGAGRAAPCAGLATPSGSNAPRSRAWASRSASLNISGMKSRFSSPMPCSPDSTPPAATLDPHDLLARGVHPLEHARLALVEHEQRVEVAVAGVEHVHHEQVVAGGDLVDLGAAPRPAALRGHDGVVQVVVRLDPGDGAERRSCGPSRAAPARRRRPRRAPSGRRGPGRSPSTAPTAAATPAGRPSTSTSSIAAASVGKPACDEVLDGAR